MYIISTCKLHNYTILCTKNSAYICSKILPVRINIFYAEHWVKCFMQCHFSLIPNKTLHKKNFSKILPQFMAKHLQKKNFSKFFNRTCKKKRLAINAGKFCCVYQTHQSSIFLHEIEKKIFFFQKSKSFKTHRPQTPQLRLRTSSSRKKKKNRTAV